MRWSSRPPLFHYQQQHFPPTIAFSGFDRLAVNTRGGSDSIAVHLDAALPDSIVLDGGNPSVGDTVTIFGSGVDDHLTLLGIMWRSPRGLRFAIPQCGVAAAGCFRRRGRHHRQQIELSPERKRCGMHVHGDVADRYPLQTEEPAVTTGPREFFICRGNVRSIDKLSVLHLAAGAASRRARGDRHRFSVSHQPRYRLSFIHQRF